MSGITTLLARAQWLGVSQDIALRGTRLLAMPRMHAPGSPTMNASRITLSKVVST